MYVAIGETITRFFSVTPRTRNGVNIGGTAWSHAAPRRKPFLHVLYVICVAQLQIFMADALAAGQQAVGELLRRPGARTAPPARTIPCGCVPRFAASALRFRALPGSAAARSDTSPVVLGKHARERNRVFHRQFGARADAEMRGMRGVADQHDIFVIPLLAKNPVELQPDRRSPSGAWRSKSAGVR